MPTAPAIIPLELIAALEGPVVRTVMTRLVSAIDGAAAKIPAKIFGFSASLSTEKTTTSVPPARAFNPIATGTRGAAKRALDGPRAPMRPISGTRLLPSSPLGKRVGVRNNLDRCLPAIPTATLLASEHESEGPEDEPDQQQDPQNVHRRREESTSTQQQQ